MEEISTAEDKDLIQVTECYFSKVQHHAKL